MMKYVRAIVCAVAAAASAPAAAIDRVVVSFADDGLGSLRFAIGGACREDGDDEISFAESASGAFRIELESSLVLPEECRGGVTIFGSSSDVILSGAGLPAEDPVIIVRGWGHILEGLNIEPSLSGVGLKVEGHDNLVIGSRILPSAQRPGSMRGVEIGVQVAGDWNTIRETTITGLGREGITITGNANVVEASEIGFIKELCPEFSSPLPPNIGPFREIWTLEERVPASPSLEIVVAEICGNSRSGIRILGSRNLIGGDQSEEGNFISDNKGYGLWIESGTANRFSGNIFARNAGGAIRVAPEADADILTPIVLAPRQIEGAGDGGAETRHVGLISAAPGSRVEIFQVETGDDRLPNRRGARPIAVVAASEGALTWRAPDSLFTESRWISAAACSEEGNCSGLSEPVELRRDSDHDHLADSLEDGDRDGTRGAIETDPFLADSDGDRLSDSVEDANGNGIVDDGETDPRSADSDGDGLRDLEEVGSDGRYEILAGDTDPRARDTDGDQLEDGIEDANHNGRRDVGETDPTNADTDGDGVRNG